MFENILNFFKNLSKKDKKENSVKSKDTAKDRLHLVLMQDRANVSADFLEMMKQEIIDVIKKYIEVEEQSIDVRLTNQVGEDGTVGAPLLYANFPIINIKNDKKKDMQSNDIEQVKEQVEEDVKEQVKEQKVAKKDLKTEKDETEETIEEVEQKEEKVEEKTEEIKKEKDGE